MANNQELLQSIEKLNEIGTALSAERNFACLLETILMGAKQLTNADGGSLYILTDRTLHFELIHTSSLNLHMGGTSGQAISFPPIPLDNPDGTPNRRMVVTCAAGEGRTINIPDAYQDREYDFSGTRAFDARTGYRSQSLLAVPMQDHEGQIIGVLQLINARSRTEGAIRAFDQADESLVASLASQAAVALNRQRLIEGLENLLQALVRLIANAIDDKSPHTGGHCRRVPAITMALAKAISADDGPRFGSVRFDQKQLEELEIAAWLHDCGKITTPEYVVDKRTKLETICDRIQLVDARIEILRRDAELDYYRTLHNPSGAGPDAGLAAAKRERMLAELDDLQAFLHRCNSGSEFFNEDARQRLEAVARQSIPMQAGDQPMPLLNADELYNLSVARGTLTNEERQIINSHIDATVRMLEALPFPEHLKDVARIAGGHHERMDGKGYPRAIPADRLPLQARILAIADVFEALTASDRTYRKPNTLSEALTIMARMCREGHFDPDLFDLLVRQEAYLDYAREYLRPEQVDAVDTPALRRIYASEQS